MSWSVIISFPLVLVACHFVPITATELPQRRTTTIQEIVVNTEEYVHETDEEFLSIALGSTLIRRGWEGFDFTSEKIKNLARGLSPAHLRIGGTDEDFLLFDEKDNHRQSAPRSEEYTITGKLDTKGKEGHYSAAYTNFTMSPSDVDKIFNFANASSLRLLFGLNVLLSRTSQSVVHSWDSKNAEKLMRYIAGKGFERAGWELGNEPVDLKRLVNRTITGEESAKDFQILRQLLVEHPEYGNLIVGPDVSSPWNGETRGDFLNEFLCIINNSIDAMTYHQYYTANNASVMDFYDPRVLDFLIKQIQQIDNIITKSGATISRWLGETSSSYGGGVPGVSDSFVAGFMWLDKLGVAARLKHNVVIRQTFYGGSYSLINRKSFNPFPDYWSSLLYKTLVGQRVLQVHGGIELDRKIRVYAHCTSKRSIYARGGVVFIVLNTQVDDDAQLVFTNDFRNLPVDQYLLTPGIAGNLTSQTVKLNGVRLRMMNDTFLPAIQPKRIIPPRGKVLLPPLSYGFFVIPEANANACQTRGLQAGYINEFGEPFQMLTEV